MKNLDIEAYLDGDLSGEALAQFEQEMRQDTAFAQQVEAQRRLAQHLRTQLVREQVKLALSEKPKNTGKTFWSWVIGVVLLCLVAYFFFGSNKEEALPNAPTLPPNTEQKPEMPTLLPTEPTTPSPNKEEITGTKPPRPIAELPLPDYPSPNVRGENAGNTEWKALLDKLWYTEFPPVNTQFDPPFADAAGLLAKREFTAAFVKLEMQERKSAQSDTLRYLKGYCLLEMGEGADALRYFDGLEVKQPEWQPQLQWYRGLAHLLTGEVKMAMPIFETIAKTPSHPLRKQGQKAVGLLQKYR